MTRFIHDQFAKDYLEELLKPYGKVKASSRVAGEIREIDVLFSPAQQANNLEMLGILGKFAATSAIFEPFRNPASEEEICDCLLKLLEVRGALQREANRNKISIKELEIPKLWILSPTVSVRILSGFSAIQASNWVSGVYLMGEYLRTAIVVIHQLPRTQETLWLRILGRGKVQRQAIDELEALSSNHPFRRATLELLYNLQQNLVMSQTEESDDRELVMRLAPLYQQDREQARQEGQVEGIKQGEERLIIRQLNHRFGEIDSSVLERIRGLSTDQLETLGEAFLDFSSLTDLETWLDQNL
ncbi:DUF4351 domain-containing protein [Nostoc flagelliforme FACHB-838]|uniref:DUF4351 domain-containing protein n=1 Tax=Nostoc flagelliforme FACHB-838 TaxID=2692904 RepID=A0ABR8DZW6_9NOSO|nr:DUF4351 domain-containing protein [Nostoc flagelliforme]MBD2535027.1 DUF4351 domain-containing protein [Nostoc flagelliforme FACHB-838]